MRLVQSRPWTVDVRFAEEPDGLDRHVVDAASAADGSTITELSVGDESWISVVSRQRRNLPFATRLAFDRPDWHLRWATGAGT